MKENKEIRELKEIDEFEALRVVWLGSAKSLSQQVHFGEEEAGAQLFNAFNAEFVKCEQRRQNFNF